ncbi:biofilm/acid-resistance regulator YmgB/AriR [Pantoea sp. BAV 3049]|uniref:biofilm/acid-resistance regulator YmgB/AriR n=1 Tax=Pantoea sp. BAV 3049 TaxID=2654188 RepID=UPI00351BC763
MQEQQTNTAAEIEAYLMASVKNMDDESMVIGEIIAELTAREGMVSNKKIIMQLLERLETEHDVVMLDVYRNALEIVVHRTPDDLVK